MAILTFAGQHIFIRIEVHIPLAARRAFSRKSRQDFLSDRCPIKPAASDIASARIDHRQHKLGGNGGINRIATALSI
jgi:hypothetical protein